MAEMCDSQFTQKFNFPNSKCQIKDISVLIWFRHQNFEEVKEKEKKNSAVHSTVTSHILR